MPRRSRSQPSSDGAAADRDERRPAAARRRGWCAWTSPVATVVGRRARSARSRSAALRRASPRSYGRWSSTKKRSRPKARREPRRRAFGSRDARGRAARSRRGRRAPRSAPRAAAGRAGPPRLRIASLLGRVLRVRRGEQPAEVRVARWPSRRAAVTCEPPSSVTSAPVIGRTPKCLRRVGELERAVDPVVVGERERRVAELGGAGGELLRQGGAVEERVRTNARAARRTGRRCCLRRSVRACLSSEFDAGTRAAARSSYSPAMPGVVHRPGEGEALFDGRIVIKANFDELCITESLFAAARPGADPHFHRQHVDSFYVLEGGLESLSTTRRSCCLRAPASLFPGRSSTASGARRARDS